jgi:hypothetical protein
MERKARGGKMARRCQPTREKKTTDYLEGRHRDDRPMLGCAFGDGLQG